MLEKESEDFASRVFPSGFFVVHDASWGGEHKVSGDTKQARQPTKQQKHRRRVQGTMRQGTVTGHSQQVGVMWRWWNPVLIEVHFYLNTHRPPRLSVYVITSQRCYLLTTTWVGNHKSIWPLHPGFVKRTIWFLRLKAFRLLKCGNVNALTGGKHNNQKPSESSSNTVHINVHHNQRTVSHQSTTTLWRCQGKNHNQRWRLRPAIKNCLLSFCPVLEHCSAKTNEEFQTDCVESLTTQFWTPHWKLLHSHK